MEWRTPHPYQLKTRLLYARVDETNGTFDIESTNRYLYVKLGPGTGEYVEGNLGFSKNVLTYEAEARLSDWRSLEDDKDMAKLKLGRYGIWMYDILKVFKCMNYDLAPTNDDYVRLTLEEDPIAITTETDGN